MDKNKCRKTLDTFQNKSELHEEIIEGEISHDLTEFSDQQIPETNKEELSEKTEPVLLTEMNNQESANTNIEETTKEIIKQSKSTQPKQRKRKIQATSGDTRLDQAFSILQSSAERDAFDIYGEHIAMKLKSYGKRTQSVVQHLINTILFNADMGQYENISGNPTATSSNTLPSLYRSIILPQYLQHPTPQSRDNSSYNSGWSRSGASTPLSIQPKSPYYGSETYPPTESDPYNENVIENNNEKNILYETLQPASGTGNTGLIQSAADLIMNFNTN